MDSVTHIVLGACIGEAIAGNKMGKKALAIGAVANSLPDIDFVASFWLPLSEELLAHRGFTHSLLFVILAAPLLAIASKRLWESTEMTTNQWGWFWGIQMLVHLFIDAFNNYGTGWLEPFSHVRISFNTMYVADPLFTIWPLLGAVLLSIWSQNTVLRKRVAIGAICISSCYLTLGILLKLDNDRHVKKQLASQQIIYNNFMSTPTPLTNMYWYCIAQDDSGFHIGYRSVWSGDKPVPIKYRPQQKWLLANSTKQEDIARLQRFSQGFYTAEKRGDSLLINDLRFGEIIGWANEHANCVFYYYPDYAAANKIVVQRGRVAGWTPEVLADYVRRILDR
jgi:inner membrane protein